MVRDGAHRSQVYAGCACYGAPPHHEVECVGSLTLSCAFPGASGCDTYHLVDHQYLNVEMLRADERSRHRLSWTSARSAEIKCPKDSGHCFRVGASGNAATE